MLVSETREVIGSIAVNLAGERRDVVLVTWRAAWGKTYYTIHAPCLGARDWLRKSSALKFAKRVYEHPSNAAVWNG